MASELKLKGTLDTIHMAYAKQLGNKGIIKSFLTLDPDLLKKEKEIKSVTKLKVIR